MDILYVDINNVFNSLLKVSYTNLEPFLKIIFGLFFQYSSF